MKMQCSAFPRGLELDPAPNACADGSMAPTDAAAEACNIERRELKNIVTIPEKMRS
jgi:hypothetical protein